MRRGLRLTTSRPPLFTHLRISRGYFEVKSRSSSSISSSFWFHQNDGKVRGQRLTCLRVSEKRAHAVPGMNTTMMCTHTHVFELTGVPREAIPQKCGCTFGDREGEKRKSNIGEKSIRPCSTGTCVPMKWGFDDGFHVYGLEWNDTSIVVYADGNQVGDAYDASCFAQKIGMDFDRKLCQDGWARRTCRLPNPLHLKLTTSESEAKQEMIISYFNLNIETAALC